MDTKAERKNKQKAMQDEMGKLLEGKLAMENLLKKLQKELDQLIEKQESQHIALLKEFMSIRQPFLTEVTKMRSENTSMTREIQRFQDLYRNLVIDYVKILEANQKKQGVVEIGGGIGNSNVDLQSLLAMGNGGMSSSGLLLRDSSPSIASKLALESTTQLMNQQSRNLHPGKDERKSESLAQNYRTVSGQKKSGVTLKDQLRAIKKFGQKLQQSSKKADLEAQRAECDNKRAEMNMSGSLFRANTAATSASKKRMQSRTSMRNSMQSPNSNFGSAARNSQKRKSNSNFNNNNTQHINKNSSTILTGFPEPDQTRTLRSAISAVRRGLDYKKKELQLQSFGLQNQSDIYQQTEPAQIKKTEFQSELSATPSTVSFQKGIQSANRLRAIVKLQSRTNLNNYQNSSMRSFSSGKHDIVTTSFDNEANRGEISQIQTRPGSSSISGGGIMRRSGGQRPISRGHIRIQQMISQQQKHSHNQEQIVNGGMISENNSSNLLSEIQDDKNHITDLNDLSPKNHTPKRSLFKSDQMQQQIRSQNSPDIDISPRQQLILHRFQHLAQSSDGKKGGSEQVYRSGFSGSYIKHSNQNNKIKFTK